MKSLKNCLPMFDIEPLVLIPDSYENTLIIKDKDVRFDISSEFNSITLLAEDVNFRLDYDKLLINNQSLTFYKDDLILFTMYGGNRYYYYPQYKYTYVNRDIWNKLITVLLNRCL